MGLCLPPRFLALGKRRGLVLSFRVRSFFDLLIVFELEDDARDPWELESAMEPAVTGRTTWTGTMICACGLERSSFLSSLLVS